MSGSLDSFNDETSQRSCYKKMNTSGKQINALKHVKLPVIIHNMSASAWNMFNEGKESINRDYDRF